MDVIQVADLRKSYGKTEVLCGISFQVREGRSLEFWEPTGPERPRLWSAWRASGNMMAEGSS